MTLLFVLVGAIPLVVLATALIAFFLVRAGYGLLVGAGVPFVVSSILIVVLSAILGRAASRPRNPPPEDERSRKRDGV